MLDDSSCVKPTLVNGIINSKDGEVEIPKSSARRLMPDSEKRRLEATLDDTINSLQLS